MFGSVLLVKVGTPAAQYISIRIRIRTRIRMRHGDRVARAHRLHRAFCCSRPGLRGSDALPKEGREVASKISHQKLLVKYRAQIY